MSSYPYTTTVQSAGTTWTGIQQPDHGKITIKGNNGAPDIALVDHILFLEWFVDSYFPEAREKFKCIQDITK